MLWLTYIVSAVAVASLAALLYVIRAVRNDKDYDTQVLFPDERRESNRLFFRLLDEMAHINGHYQRFTRRVIIMLIIVSSSLLVSLGVVEVLIYQNRQVIKAACKDIENVKTAVRATLTEFIPDRVARIQAVDKFKEQECPHPQPN